MHRGPTNPSNDTLTSREALGREGEREREMRTRSRSDGQLSEMVAHRPLDPHGRQRQRESQRTCFVEVRETRAVRNVDWMVDDRLALRQRERRCIDCLAACSRNLLQLCTAHSIHCAWHSHLLLDSRHFDQHQEHHHHRPHHRFSGSHIDRHAQADTTTREERREKREERREAEKVKDRDQDRAQNPN